MTFILRKRALALGISAVLLSTSAQAIIPTTDVAHITTSVQNQIETIAQWAQQLESMKQQYEQIKQQYTAMIGARKMSSPYRTPNDWGDIIESAKANFVEERKLYPTFSGRVSLPRANKLYDTIASQKSVMKALFDKSKDRAKNIDRLMGLIESAEDPAAKQELTNRLINEQNAIQANNSIASLLKARHEQELKADAIAAQREIGCKEFNKTLADDLSCQ